MGFTNFRPPSPHFTDGNAEAKATKPEAAQDQAATCIKLSLPLQDTLLDWPPSLGSEPLSPSPCHHSTHQFCAEGEAEAWWGGHSHMVWRRVSGIDGRLFSQDRAGVAPHHPVPLLS